MENKHIISIKNSSLLFKNMQHLLHLLSGYFSVKKCEGFEILPYLQVSKLAYHHFMDAGRSHEDS